MIWSLIRLKGLFDVVYSLFISMGVWGNALKIGSRGSTPGKLPIAVQGGIEEQHPCEGF